MRLDFFEAVYATLFEQATTATAPIACALMRLPLRVLVPAAVALATSSLPCLHCHVVDRCLDSMVFRVSRETLPCIAGCDSTSIAAASVAAVAQTHKPV